jgi:hypothetical protein
MLIQNSEPRGCELKALDASDVEQRSQHRIRNIFINMDVQGTNLAVHGLHALQVLLAALRWEVAFVAVFLSELGDFFCKG